MACRDATFFENIFPMKNKMTKQVGENLEEDNLRSNLDNGIHTEVRRSKRGRIKKDFGPDFYTFLIEDDPKTFTGYDVFRCFVLERDD